MTKKYTTVKFQPLLKSQSLAYVTLTYLHNNVGSISTPT